jgi:galactose mutarotase-like enzyme
MIEQCLSRIEKENVLIQAGDCCVTILPQLGGKIASILLKNRELLQAPLAPLAPRTHTMPFHAGDASGWDECLPSVGECNVQTTAGSHFIPDHGDLWRVEWNTVSANSTSVVMEAQCFSLPLALRRTIKLTEDDDGWHILLHYELTNIGNHPVPWSWAAHPLFAAEEGDRIVLPDSIRSLRVEGSGGGRLGATNEIVSWPAATLADGSLADLSKAQSLKSGIGDKLFAGPLAVSENWCAFERPSARVRIRVSFDPAATPYLGLWICHGGWPDRPSDQPGPKQSCVALEPATAPVDSLALTGPWSLVLEPGQRYSWPMSVDLELL